MCVKDGEATPALTAGEEEEEAEAAKPSLGSGVEPPADD